WYDAAVAQTRDKSGVRLPLQFSLVPIRISFYRPRRPNMVLPLGDYQRTRIVPFVTYAIITINIVVFLIQEDRGERFTLAYAATPWEITHNEDIDEAVSITQAVRIPDRFGR